MVEILFRHSGPILSLKWLLLAFPPKFGRRQGPMDGTFLFYECRLSGGTLKLYLVK